MRRRPRPPVTAARPNAPTQVPAGEPGGAAPPVDVSAADTRHRRATRPKLLDDARNEPLDTYGVQIDQPATGIGPALGALTNR
jgi:hypothetical protein